MCTVTYIPHSEGFVFTSSRDEQASRLTAPPKAYFLEGKELIFPKDEVAGGTWIASALEGRTACLLNGAFERHVRKKTYSKSRGIILLESFNYANTRDFHDQIELNNIEPFTMITLDYKAGTLTEFYEFRWDGEKKLLKKLDPNECQIWSSATLYLKPAQLLREELFNKWIEKHKNDAERDIINFHNRKHGLKIHEDILMKGIADLMTLSISQINFKKGQAHFNYIDLIENKQYRMILQKKESTHA